MKGVTRIVACCTFAALALVLCTAGVSAADTHPGQQVFMDQKCNNCHAVSSAKIEAKMKGAMAGPDLAGIGAKKDAAWLKSFLEQKTEVDGKKHKSAYKGTPEQLDKIVEWLASLK